MPDQPTIKNRLTEIVKDYCDRNDLRNPTKLHVSKADKPDLALFYFVEFPEDRDSLAQEGIEAVCKTLYGMQVFYDSTHTFVE